MSRGYPVAPVLLVGRQLEKPSVGQLLKYLANLPVRHSSVWSRDDHYGGTGSPSMLTFLPDRAKD